MVSFAELFEASQSEQGLNIERGSVISGTVVAIDSDWITVDTGLKSEGIVAREEFLNEAGELEVAVGDSIDVVVEAVDNGMGQTVLSREKRSVKKAGVRLNNYTKMMKSLKALFHLKLKAVSLLRSVQCVHSFQGHW